MEYFKFLYSSPPSIKINLLSNNHKSYKYITKDNEIKEYPENKDENLIENKNESIEGTVKEESKEKKQEIDSHSSKDMKTLREKIVYTSEQSKNNDYKEVINDNKEEKKEEIKDKSKAENNDENKEEFKEEINDKINNNNSSSPKRLIMPASTEKRTFSLSNLASSLVSATS